MNRIYSLVYNVVLGQVQVASELAAGASATVARPPVRRPMRRLPMAVAIGLGLCGSLQAQDMPVLNGLRGGGAVYTPDTGTITQTSKKAILDWKTFNIADGNTLSVIGPGVTADSVTLNLVNEGSSTINGTLNSPGHFFLINPRGVVFGSSAQVNVAGLLASSAAMTVAGNGVPAGFDPTTGVGAGQYDFNLVADGSAGAVRVETGATINTPTSVLLIGNTVNNDGTIEAPQVGLIGYQVINSGTLKGGAEVTLQGGVQSASLGYTDAGAHAFTQVTPVDPAPPANQQVVTNTSAGKIQAPAITVISHAGAINLDGEMVATSHLHIDQKDASRLALLGKLQALSSDVAAPARITLQSSGSIVQQGGSVKANQLTLGGSGASPTEVYLTTMSNQIGSIAGAVNGNLSLVTSHPGVLAQHGALAVAGSASLSALGGALGLDHSANTFGGNVQLLGSGIVLTASGNLIAQQINGKGQDVTLTSTGLLQLAGPDAVDTGGAALRLKSTAGAVMVDTVVKAGTLSIDSAGDATFNANVTTTGGLRVTTLGGDIKQASRALFNVTGDAQLSAGSTSPVNGNVLLGDVLLGNAGNIFSGTLDVHGDQVEIGAGGTAPLKLGNIAANSLKVTTSSSGIQHQGTMTVRGNATLNAGTGSLAISNAGVDGDLIATGSSITQTGSLRVDGNATLNAGTGSLAISNAAIGGDLSAAGRSITQTGTASVTGKADLVASAAIALAGVTAGELTADAGHTLSINGANVAGHAGLSSRNTMTLASVEAGSLEAAATTLNVSAGVIHGNADLTSSSTLSIDTLHVDGNLVAIGKGITQAGTLGVDGDATLWAGTADLAINNTTVGQNLTASAASITQTGTATVTGKADLDTSGAIALVDFKAGALDATASAITQTGTLQVAGLADLDATNGMVLAGVTAGSLKASAADSLRINGANVSGLADLASGNSMTLTGVEAGSLIAGSKALTVRSGVIHSSAQLKATGSKLIIDTLQVGGSLQATGAGIAQTGTLTVAGAVSLNAGSASLEIHNASVGQGLTATGSSITQTGTASVTGKADLDTPGAIALVDFKAGALDATASAITQTGSLQVGGLADLDASGAIALAAVTAGTLSADAGDTLRINGANVAGHAALTAGNAMTLANVEAGSLHAAADALSVSAGVIRGDASLTARDSVLLIDGLDVVGDLTATGVGITQTGRLTTGGDATLLAGTEALTLRSVEVGGALQATGAGITQAGTLAVDGDATLDAGNGNLIINNASVGQNLTASAASITQTGTASVTGSADLDATGAITLVDFSAGALDATASAITQTGSLQVGGLADLDASGAIALAAVTAGTLSADAGDTLRINGANVAGHAALQSGDAMTLAGITADSLAAAANGLTASGLQVSHDADLQAGSNTLLLGATSIGGSLDASGAAIAQTGALLVAGSSRLQAAGDLILDQADNRFGGAVNLQAQQATIVSDAGLELAEVDVRQLRARAAGTLLVGSAAIAQNAQLSGTRVVLGDVMVGNALQVDSAADISQTSALYVGGSATLQAGGAITLDHAGNDFVGAVAAHGTSIQLADANALEISALGNRGGTGDIHVLAAGDLSVRGQGVAGGVGNVSLQTLAGKMTIEQALEGAQLRLEGYSGLDLAADIRAGKHVDLRSNGDVKQTSGSIIAPEVTATVGGGLDLHGENRIAMLGDVRSAALALRSNGDLRIAGTVQSDSQAVINVRDGNLQLDGQVAATDLRLQASGDIGQGSNGVLQAERLSGFSGGSTTLGTASGFVPNQVATLGDFNAAGGFSMTNAGSLTLASLNGSAFSVNAGTAAFFLKVQGGDVSQAGTTPVVAGNSRWWSSGRIGSMLAPIYLVTSASEVSVDHVGLPPAYFYATDAAGVPIPLKGAVNAFSLDDAAREQVAAMSRGVSPRQGEMMPSPPSITIAQTGIALPAGQARACEPSLSDRSCIE